MSRIRSILAARPGSLLFLFTLLFALLLTRARLNRWETLFPEGDYDISGIIQDEGIPTPLHAGGSQLQIIRMEGGVPLAIRMKEPGRRGDRVTGRVRIRWGQGSRNPGGFSERTWLWGQGTALFGSGLFLHVEQKDSPSLTLARLPGTFRALVRTRFKELWESRGGPLLLSLSAGDTRLLDDWQSYSLRTCGLSHLTSVSGTHLAFLMLPARKAMTRLGLSKRLQLILTLALILVPGLLSGWKSGVSRATLMTLAAQLDQPFRRRRELFNSLFLSCALLLALEPYAVYDASFWMSMTAAATVSFVSSLQASAFGLDRTQRLRRTIRSSLVTASAAQLVLLPYLAAGQSGLNLLTPLVNLAAFPLASVLTASAYAVLGLGLLLSPWPILQSGLAGCAGLLLSGPSALLLGISQAAAKIRWAFVPLKFGLLLLPLGLLLYLCRRRGNFRKGIRRSGHLLNLACLLVLVFLLFRPGPDMILFLDVGQGDASLIRGGGVTILVDGGDRGQGYRTVIPALRAMDGMKLDLALVTHAHSDHAYGVLELIRAGLVDCLCLPAADPGPVFGQKEEEDLSGALLAQAAESGVPVRYLAAGDVIRLAGGSLEVLHPQADEKGSLNNLSLVMKVTLGEVTILMTGDLENQGEGVLMAGAARLDAGILHVGHHGSKSSTQETFLDRVAPGAAVISVSAGNRYGHPHKEVLERLEARGIPVFRTDQCGAVFLRIKDGKGRISPWIKGR